MTAAAASTSLDPARLASARRRSQWVLGGGVALSSIGTIAAFTVAALAAQAILGSSALSGLPGATYVLGSAAGSIGLSSLMARTTRRLGLTLGYLGGVAGAIAGAAGVAAGSFGLLLLGMALLGTGNSAAQLARYAAADLVPAARRASAIGAVVWASTIGSVVGPSLAEPAGAFARGIGLPALAGPFLIPSVFAGLAALGSFGLLRPDPYELATAGPATAGAGRSTAQLRAILARPVVVAAIAALIVAQFTMVLIMTMTPLHMAEHGSGLAAVGLVLSAHTLGMFGLAPISGRLVERLGALTTVFLGTGTLVTASVLAALAPADGGPLLGLALFLLGYGWNLGFVAGSTMLSSGLEVTERTRVQGIADALVWTSSAIASVGSGLVLQAAGFTSLGFLGAAVVLVPVWLFVTRRRSLLAPRSGGLAS